MFFIDFTQISPTVNSILRCFQQFLPVFVTFLSISGKFIQSPLGPAIEGHTRGAEGNPQGYEHGADLPQEISRLTPVVPDGEIPVHQQPCCQLYRRDSPAPAPILAGTGSFRLRRAPSRRKHSPPAPNILIWLRPRYSSSSPT